MATLTYSGQLTIVSCWCGIPHAIPTELDNYRRRKHSDGQDCKVYCPLGHIYIIAGEGKADRLARKLEAEHQKRIQVEQAHDQTKAELRETEFRCRAEKAAKTRIKNRVKNGVCIYCNRTFRNLATHMQQEHNHTEADGCEPKT